LGPTAGRGVEEEEEEEDPPPAPSNPHLELTTVTPTSPVAESMERVTQLDTLQGKPLPKCLIGPRVADPPPPPSVVGPACRASTCPEFVSIHSTTGSTGTKPTPPGADLMAMEPSMSPAPLIMHRAKSKGGRERRPPAPPPPTLAPAPDDSSTAASPSHVSAASDTRWDSGSNPERSTRESSRHSVRDMVAPAGSAVTVGSGRREVGGEV